MANGVQEENSNSQNGNFVVGNILYLKNNRCRVEFLEGETLNLDMTLLLEEPLYSGSVLSSSQIEDMKTRSAVIEAERVSLKLISNYLHSQTALRNKLIKKGFNKSVIDQVILRLVTLGYLNDTEYAEAWLRARLERHPEGKIRLIAGLRQRGISYAIAQQVVDENFSRELECSCIQEVIVRRKDRQGLDRDRTKKLLLNRGFSRSLVEKELDALEW